VKHSSAVASIEIARVIVANRHRKDMGDLEVLAASLATEGLLQPIGITEQNELVFGERRLRAAQILGWTKIDARVVRVSSILNGEYTENELRKDFTPSERVAIADAIQGAMPERRGRPSENVQNIAPLYPQGKTRDIAAEKAGFANHTSYEQARAVVHKAVEQIITQMDRGELSISAAAAIAKQPKREQERIAALPRTEKKAEVRKLRQFPAAHGKTDAEQAESLRKFSRLADSIGYLIKGELTPADFVDLFSVYGVRCDRAGVATAAKWISGLEEVLRERTQAIAVFREATNG